MLNHPDLWRALLPKLTPASHKYSRGYSLIIGGYPITGAARLAAYAAARIGSGLTALLVPEIAFSIYASALTSILVRGYQSTIEFNAHINDPRINSYLIGPGAGVNAKTRAALFAILNQQKPVVIDADAISVCQDDLITLGRAIQSPCVLTPHEVEFKRLFSLDDNKRILSVQRAAENCGATIVLKGSETIIAAPDGSTIINQPAPPTLATGGSGDVLAGMITGLMAQGMTPFYAAAAATWIHAEAAKAFGLGLMAEDLPALIPQILHKIDR